MQYQRNPASQARLDSLANAIKNRHPEATNTEIESIIETDPSDNKIFSEWMAYKVFGDEESVEAALDAAFHLNALYVAGLLSPNIPLRGSIEQAFQMVQGITPRKTTRNMERLSRCTEYQRDLVFEDPRLIVLEPQTHRDSCCYAQESRRRWCASDPTDASEFNRLEQIRQHMGPVKFFVIVNKLLPLSNKYSHIGMVVYQGTIDEMSHGRSDREMIREAKQRFRQQYGEELAYTDEFLLESQQQLRDMGFLAEMYDTNNAMILAKDMEKYLGDDLLQDLTGRVN